LLAHAGHEDLARAQIEESRAVDTGVIDPRQTIDCLGEEMEAHLVLDDLPRVIEIGLTALDGVQEWDARHTYSAQIIYVMVGQSLLELGRVSKAAEVLDPITPRDGSVARALRTRSGPTRTWLGEISPRQTNSGAPNPPSAEAGR
jgi:hypothetical protein